MSCFGKHSSHSQSPFTPRTKDLPLGTLAHPISSGTSAGAALSPRLGSKRSLDIRESLGLGLALVGLDSEGPVRHSRRVASSQFSRETASEWSARDFSRSNTYSSGSARPFLTSRSVSTPNKLVKRSLSQHTPSTDPLPNALARRHTLKRPATSHQRSATLSLQAPALDSEETSTGEVVSQIPSWSRDEEKKSKHFFQVRRARELLKGSHPKRSPKDHSAIFRIYPDGTQPSLLLATTVARPETSFDRSAETESINSPESSPLSSSPFSRTSRVQRPSATRPDRPRTSRLEGQKRRSFTIGGFLHDSPSPSPKRLLRHQSSPQAKLRQKVDQRIASAPMMSTHQGKPANWDSPLRKNLNTDKQYEVQTFDTGSGSPQAANSSTSQLRHSTSRPSRQSRTPSDLNSSNPGSVSAPRVFSWVNEEDADLNSDTVYDSMRTGTTRSSLGHPRPPLESLFHDVDPQDSPQYNDHKKQNRYFSSSAGSYIDDGGRTPINPRHIASQQIPLYQSSRNFGAYWSSDANLADAEMFEDEGWDDPGLNLNAAEAERRAQDWEDTENPGDAANLRLHENSHSKDGNTKSNLFDWSEEPAIDKVGASETPPRPRTVHGKKHPDSRITRSTGRRAPSGLHARSQSVPVFQEITGRTNDVTRKFGTWGVGSKAVTEDWDEDFDFGDAYQPALQGSEAAEGRIDSGVSMIVPESIRIQQSHLLVDIGLLREWGLQIEELKDLRMRAVLLGLTDDPDSAATFAEVDAMVELADQETEDNGLTGLRSPASSQHFTDDGFDTTNSPQSEPAPAKHYSPKGILHNYSRKSESARPSPQSAKFESPEAPTRPRKDSEAVARSVIETLQRPRNTSESRLEPERSPSRKVPFDTATLKHIVPHVKDLTRRVKQVLREAEGLNPNAGDAEHAVPPLTRAFIEPVEESPTAQRERRLRASQQITDARGVRDEGNPPGDIVSRLRLMNVSQ